MGVNAIKQDLREKIVTYQYNMANEDIWQLLDTYDMYLEASGTSDELAEAAFLRGDAAFHMGRYYDTVKALTKSLGIEKTPEYSYLEADAYNLLGMLFSFGGYETVALENYLAAIESAKKYRHVQEHVGALLNAGLLYQGLMDYRKAMMYYKRGYEVANNEHSTPEMMLMLLCLLQEAQLYCKMGRYDKAEELKREIESYSHVVEQEEVLLPKCILEAWMEVHQGTEKSLSERIEKVWQFLKRDTECFEQIDFYVDFCRFLLENDREEDARKFLDLIKEKLRATEFLHLQMQMEELEVQYQKRYGEETRYLKACQHYMMIQEEYERTLKEFKQKNLSNIENLQELEQQQREFEFRSKCDLATGLLNRDTFRFEVENYLGDRNRNVMDAMVIIDIDNFKLINDSYGHLVGDEVIKKLAALMQKYFGREAFCGRFGGDEFVIFVKQIKDLEEIEMRVETLREEFGNTGFGKNENVHNSVSIGVSYNHGVNASYKTMLACADEALLKAKEYGKNRAAFFEIKRGLLKYV